MQKLCQADKKLFINFCPWNGATIRRRSASYGGTGGAAEYPAFFEKG